jgi:bacterial/archaeal transporter family-2 protein
MKLVYIIPLLIGILGILQGALIKNVSLEIGVAHAILIAMTIYFFLGIVLFIFIRSSPQALPPFYAIKYSLTYFKWWYLIPGLLGFFIVFFFPQAMNELGAVKVTILIVGGQIITSTLWDFFVDEISLTSYKAMGLFFAILSVVFSVVEKKV